MLRPRVTTGDRGTDRPADARDLQRENAEKELVTLRRARHDVGPDEQQDAAESDEQAEAETSGERAAVAGDHTHADHPEGNGGDLHRGDAARPPLPRPDGPAVA